MPYKILIKSIIIPDDIRENARVIYSVKENDREIYEQADFVDAGKLTDIAKELNNIVASQVLRRKALKEIDTDAILGELDVEQEVIVESELANDIVVSAVSLALTDATEIDIASDIQIVGAEAEETKVVKSKKDNTITLDVGTKNEYKKGDKIKQTKIIKL